MPTVVDHLAALYKRANALDARVSALERGDDAAPDGNAAPPHFAQLLESRDSWSVRCSCGWRELSHDARSALLLHDEHKHDRQ